MNLRDVELFSAVMRHGGVGRAGAAHGVGQPNVSRAIGALERDLGFALFLREKQRLIPTAEGEAFYREVERSFAGLDRLRLAAADIRAFGTGTLRIACMVALALDLAPRALRRFMALYPEATVSFQARPSSQVWDYTANGQCEIGFAGPKEGFSGVNASSFSDAAGVVVLPRGHLLARKRIIEPNDLEGQSFLSLALEDPTRHLIDAAFAKAGVKRRMLVETQPSAMLCAMVAERLGVSIVNPISAADQIHRGLVVKPFGVVVPFVSQVLTVPNRPISKFAAAFLAQMEVEREVTLAKISRRPHHKGLGRRSGQSPV